MEEHLAVMYERLRQEVSQFRSDLHPPVGMQVALETEGWSTGFVLGTTGEHRNIYKHFPERR